MDSKQPFIVESANQKTNITLRKLPEKTPSSSAEAEATLLAHSENCNLNVPPASPFYAIFEDSAAPVDYHGEEGRDFTIEEIVVSAV